MPRDAPGTSSIAPLRARARRWSSEALLERLHQLGADPGLISWLKSYMEVGMQRVKWNGTLSDFLLNELGCQQGSILGPLLFLILSLDVPMVLGEKDTTRSDSRPRTPCLTWPPSCRSW